MGPLEVVQDGQSARVAAPKQRALLALLLLNANREVARDRLIDQLWDGEPPTEAKATLQSYIYRLRKRFTGPECGVRLEGGRSGYTLEVAAEALDTHRFDRLITHARHELQASRFDEAVRALRTGLKLWRGPIALADVDIRAVRDKAHSLSEQRLAARELCLNTELGLGRHSTVVAEAREFTAEYPWREEAWILLMTALYRCGRPAESLEVYQRLYRQLNEELGIQPTAPVRKLHQRILANDPGLRQSAVQAAPEAVAPRQLPADSSGFVGRVEQLAQLDNLLAGHRGNGSGPIAAVTGPAGIGKTALAVHWAQRVSDRFRDGQLYVNLRGYDPADTALDTADVLRLFLVGLGVDPDRIPTDADARTGLYRTLLGEKAGADLVG